MDNVTVPAIKLVQMKGIKQNMLKFFNFTFRRDNKKLFHSNKGTHDVSVNFNRSR